MNHLLSPAPIPRAFIHLRSVLADNVISSLSLPAHSWTRNFYNFALLAPFGFPTTDSTWGNGHANFKDSSATVQDLSSYMYAWSAVNSAQDNTYGIIVGTSDAAESFDHVALTAKIAHGTGPGQLSHRAMPALTVSWAAGSKTLSLFLSRLFDNLSGSTITVKESGIISTCYYTAYKFLFCRDVLSPALDVLNSGTLTVTYEAQLVYP